MGAAEWEGREGEGGRGEKEGGGRGGEKEGGGRGEEKRRGGKGGEGKQNRKAGCGQERTEDEFGSPVCSVTKTQNSPFGTGGGVADCPEEGSPVMREMTGLAP